MKILLIDAYDSFVYIIKNYLERMHHQVDIVRCDKIINNTLLTYQAVILGPGPGHPGECGYLEVIAQLEGRLPIFGICLGMQAIAEYYGVTVSPASSRQHGKVSSIINDGCGCFTDLPKEFNVTRYHSLIADRDKFAHSLLQVTAISQLDGYVMALKHPELPIEGVQFHPESITTENGFRLIENFFRYTVNAHYFSSQSGGNCINELPAR